MDDRHARVDKLSHILQYITTINFVVLSCIASYILLFFVVTTFIYIGKLFITENIAAYIYLIIFRIGRQRILHLAS